MQRQLPTLPDHVVEALRDLSEERRVRDPLGLEDHLERSAYRRMSASPARMETEADQDPAPSGTPKKPRKQTGQDKPHAGEGARLLRSTSKQRPEVIGKRSKATDRPQRSNVSMKQGANQKGGEVSVQTHTTPDPSDEPTSEMKEPNIGAEGVVVLTEPVPDDVIDDQMEIDKQDPSTNPQETYFVATTSIFDPADLSGESLTAPQTLALQKCALCMENLLAHGFAKDISADVSNQGIVLRYTRLLPAFDTPPGEQTCTQPPATDPASAHQKSQDKQGPPDKEAPPAPTSDKNLEPPLDDDEQFARQVYRALQDMTIEVPSRSPGQMLSVKVSAVPLRWSVVWDYLKAHNRVNWFIDSASDPAGKLAFCAWSCRVPSLMNTISPVFIRDAIKGAPV
ncbi:putative phosphoprotein [Huangpi Tick Virus 3]|uniref:Putative phosphoprotein n=1 Tax=Huangpi Tick Virus 3 TaxID=1608049 RepID=A0A0B5KET9_9RHAB|nr:putative phosphoprotein [Huangpi Tick Virus 3]AJG39104.1 putative phosphoprotein [Huangpi Tick Virus 3]